MNTSYGLVDFVERRMISVEREEYMVQTVTEDGLFPRYVKRVFIYNLPNAEDAFT